MSNVYIIKYDKIHIRDVTFVKHCHSCSQDTKIGLGDVEFDEALYMVKHDIIQK